MRGGVTVTAYVWLTFLYPSLGWVLGGISGRTTGLNIGGNAAASYYFSTRHDVRHGWVVSIPAVVGESCASQEFSTEEDLQRLTVVQLKDRLRGIGLMVSGNKAELVERLYKGMVSSSMNGNGKMGGNNIYIDSTTPHSCKCNTARRRSKINTNRDSTINSLVRQKGECPECVILLDGEKMPTSLASSNSNPTNGNNDDEQLEISRFKPKQRLLTDDDLLPPKRSKHSPSHPRHVDRNFQRAYK